MLNPAKSSQIPGIPWSSWWNPPFPSLGWDIKIPGWSWCRSNISHRTQGWGRPASEWWPEIEIQLKIIQCDNPMILNYLGSTCADFHWMFWIPTDYLWTSNVLTKWESAHSREESMKYRRECWFSTCQCDNFKMNTSLIHVRCSTMQWCPVRWSSPLVLERLPEHLLEAVPFELPGRSATHLGSLAYALAVLSALYDILRPSVCDSSILLQPLPWRIYGKAPEPHTNFCTTILGSPKMRRQALSHLNLKSQKYHVNHIAEFMNLFWPRMFT